MYYSVSFSYFPIFVSHRKRLTLNIHTKCVPCALYCTFTFLQDLHRVSDFQREAMLDSPSETDQHCKKKRHKTPTWVILTFEFSYAEWGKGPIQERFKTKSFWKITLRVEVQSIICVGEIKAYINNKISLLCFCTNSYTKQTYINICCAIQNIWSWICIQKLSFEDRTFQTSATIKRKTENINFWKVWKDCYSNLTMGTCSVTPPTQSWTLRGHKSFAVMQR